jgi:hypothetical protein
VQRDSRQILQPLQPDSPLLARPLWWVLLGVRLFDMHCHRVFRFCSGEVQLVDGLWDGHQPVPHPARADTASRGARRGCPPRLPARSRSSASLSCRRSRPVSPRAASASGEAAASWLAHWLVCARVTRVRTWWPPASVTWQVPVASLRFLLRRCIESVLARVALLLLGYWHISAVTPERNRMRLRCVSRGCVARPVAVRRTHGACVR